MISNFHHVHMIPRVLHVCRSVPARNKAAYPATAISKRSLHLELRSKDLGVATDALDGCWGSQVVKGVCTCHRDLSSTARQILSDLCICV